jgi:hypothetical protein
LTLTNCTFTQNSANDGVGGAIALDASNTTIAGCTINGNTSINAGGGVYAVVSVVTFTNCTVSGNTTNFGGGIFAEMLSEVTVSNSTITSNNADAGGGIYVDFVFSLTLENSTISGNTAVAAGGIYVDNNSLSYMTNCTISGNTASNDGAGGICAVESIVYLNNCTISGNVANNYYGGGIIADTSLLYLTNCSIAGNEAIAGAGIFAVGTNLTTCNIYMTNSIVAYNYLSDNSGYADIAKDAFTAIYGNYNITSFTGWNPAGSGNIEYTYVNGKGASLFAQYTTIAASAIYAPVLADNGGTTLTLALDNSCSIALAAGCRTGIYVSGGYNEYAFSTNGVTWRAVEDGSVILNNVAEITSDQRGKPRSTVHPTIGAAAYQNGPYSCKDSAYNNVNMFNDGTQTETRTSWRNSIDNNDENPDNIDGNSSGEPGKINLDNWMRAGRINRIIIDGEHGMQNFQMLYRMNNGEFSISFMGNKHLEEDYRTRPSRYPVNLALESFETMNSDNILNHDGIALSEEKHPAFKTELDLVLENIV